MPVGETVAVDAHFDITGDVTPRQFVWRGSILRVEGVGRRWREGRERCFTVIAAGGRPFELRLHEDTFCWCVTFLGASNPVV
jgi:hypothetical protein